MPVSSTRDLFKVMGMISEMIGKGNGDPGETEGGTFCS